ncbi:hypothetical protein PR048_024699 [Dryococelus australis]|uniref:Uncharacterized protein n=1 Tax=Dryococelus australis TaxID=614101 RepID=A0ABQ9GPE0_9NEOP|nr:hypothetical protein PR048_024699 [Dryococelus australis]
MVPISSSLAYSKTSPWHLVKPPPPQNSAWVISPNHKKPKSGQPVGVSNPATSKYCPSPLRTRGSPLVDDRPIMNAVKYRVVSGVIWTNRTMVSSNTDANRTGVLAAVDIDDSLLICLKCHSRYSKLLCRQCLVEVSVTSADINQVLLQWHTPKSIHLFIGILKENANKTKKQKTVRELGEPPRHAIAGGHGGVAARARLLPRRTEFVSRRDRSRIFARGNRAGRRCWSAGFLGAPPFPPHSDAAPYTPRFSLAGSQHFELKSRPNVSNPILSKLPCLYTGYVTFNERYVALQRDGTLLSELWRFHTNHNELFPSLAFIERIPDRFRLADSFISLFPPHFLLRAIKRSSGMQGRGKRENPEKTRRPTASSGTIPTCENPVTRPGIKPGSPCWEATYTIVYGEVVVESDFAAAAGRRRDVQNKLAGDLTLLYPSLRVCVRPGTKLACYPSRRITFTALSFSLCSPPSDFARERYFERKTVVFLMMSFSPLGVRGGCRDAGCLLISLEYLHDVSETAASLYSLYLAFQLFHRALYVLSVCLRDMTWVGEFTNHVPHGPPGPLLTSKSWEPMKVKRGANGAAQEFNGERKGISPGSCRMTGISLLECRFIAIGRRLRTLEEHVFSYRWNAHRKGGVPIEKRAPRMSRRR